MQQGMLHGPHEKPGIDADGVSDWDAGNEGLLGDEEQDE